jgi:serine/threonine-protein kinase
MSKAITEEGAQKRGVRADRLRDQLSGDLEAIVGKALAGLPKDRYASVAALSEDLERFLANRPILAQKQTTLYRTKKYVARNRGALSVSAVLAIGLLVLGGYALWQQQKALQAGRRAQATAQFLNWMIETANPINGGSPTRTVRDMIERAKPRIEKGLAEYPEVFTPLASNLGDFLYNAGRPEAGLDWLAKSVARSRQMNSPRTVLIALAPFATTLSIVGKCPEAQAAEKEMKQLLAGVESQLSAVERVNVHTAIAYPESFCDLDDAASLKSMDLAYQASKQVPNNSLETDFPARLFKGVLAVNYASSLRDGKRGTEARAVLREGLELIQSEPDAGPVRVAILRSRSALEANEGAYLESAQTLREILKLPSEGLAPLEVVRLHSVLAIRLASAEQYPEALAEVKIAVEETERRLAELGGNAYIVYIDASVASSLAGACDETQRYLERVQALSHGQMGAHHVVNFDSARAVCAVKRETPAEALRLVRAVIEKHKVEEKPTRPMGKALRAAEARAKATLEQNP